MASVSPEITAKRRQFVADERRAAETEGRPFPRDRAFTRQTANPTYQTYNSAINHRRRRGLPIDPWWADPVLGFERFVVDMGERPDGTQCAMRDPSGPWGRGNVRWATDLERRRSGWSGNVREIAAERAMAVKYFVARDQSGRLAQFEKMGLFRRQKPNPLFRTWAAVHNRCYDDSHPSYANYGGRGIRMHEAWEGDFECFAADVLLEIGPKPSPRHSLDRIDPDGDYEPGNLRWATASEQNLNKRTGPADPVADEARFMAKQRARWDRLGVEVDEDGFIDPSIGPDGSELPPGVVMVEASEL